MRLKKAKFIFPILSMMAIAVLFVFFGMSQVKAIDIFDSWMQIGMLDLVGVFAVLKLLTPPVLPIYRNGGVFYCLK